MQIRTSVGYSKGRNSVTAAAKSTFSSCNDVYIYTGNQIGIHNAIPNGDQLVMTALGGTGVIFLGLSAYALKSRKDFSFMGGMLFAGILVAFLAGLGAAVFSIPALSLAVSAMFIILMSGMILYQTSAIIHGGETNYIMATITLYVSIYNLFLSLLQILGIFGGDD